MREMYVRVQLAEWKHEWRTVRAESLEEALVIAKEMPDVIAVLEASIVPGGVAC